MKTQTNINLKKMALTAFAALVISTVSFEQPQAANFNSEAVAALVNLESLMVLTEQNITYVAPAAEAADDFIAAQDRLEMLAAATEASLEYNAPSENEVELFGAEWERLELLAGATEAILQYRAPEANETRDAENANEVESEIMLAHRTN